MSDARLTNESISMRLVRWAFARLYHEFAFSYDLIAVAVSWGHWRQWGQAIVPYVSGDTLELGCGPGHLQRILSSRLPSQTVVGFDYSPNMLALARRRAQHLVRGTAEQLPFATSRFECVVATFPSEYITSPSTLAEIRRVVHSGGRVCIVLGAQLQGPAWYRHLVQFAYRITQQNIPDQPQHVRAIGLLDALEAAGFSARDAWLDAPGGHVYCVFADVPQSTSEQALPTK